MKGCVGEGVGAVLICLETNLRIQQRARVSPNPRGGIDSAAGCDKLSWRHVKACGKEGCSTVGYPSGVRPNTVQPQLRTGHLIKNSVV